MTDAVTFQTDLDNGADAGAFLGARVSAHFDGEAPDALIVFASSKYDYKELLSALKTACRPKVMIGCSSGGEFVKGRIGDGCACTIAIRSDEMRFSLSIGRSLRSSPINAARELSDGLNKIDDKRYPYRAALVLADALAGHSAELIEQLSALTPDGYQFFGGAASDGAKFRRTPVFFGTGVFDDAAVALEILSSKPVGISVAHGWRPAGRHVRVTKAVGANVVHVDAAPAVRLYEAHAAIRKQRFNHSAPLPFFIHNVIGVRDGDSYRLRVPIAVNADGAIRCATEVTEGADICIMSATGDSTFEATSKAVRDAAEQLGGNTPCLALFFDCVATRLRLGNEGFDRQLEAIQQTLGPVECAGFNSHGQVVHAAGQINGSHNCTALVFLLPS